MITIDEALHCLDRLITFLEEKRDYSEFMDDLYSILDALNEEKGKE